MGIEFNYESNGSFGNKNGVRTKKLWPKMLATMLRDSAKNLWHVKVASQGRHEQCRQNCKTCGTTQAIVTLATVTMSLSRVRVAKGVHPDYCALGDSDIVNLACQGRERCTSRLLCPWRQWHCHSCVSGSRTIPEQHKSRIFGVFFIWSHLSHFSSVLGDSWG